MEQGRKKTGGRKPGVPNKITSSAKANVMAVFEMLGGAKGYAEWARENQKDFYNHYVKLIPVEVTGKDDEPIKVEVDMTEVAKTIAFLFHSATHQ